MSDLPETDSEGLAGEEPVGTPAPTRRRRLDGRMIAIVVCVALVGAIATALIVSAIVEGNDGGGTTNGSSPGSPHIELSNAKINGPKLLAIKLVTVTGADTTLAAALGDKATLVNLWQQSCTACVEEMPILDELHQRNDRVDVLGVDVQDPLKAAQQMATKTAITYPWLRDPDGDFFYAAQGAALPISLLVDPSGKVLTARTGTFHSAGELDAWLDDHLR